MSFTKISSVALLSMAGLSSMGASAALFDTIDSVETIQKVVAQKEQKTDRMPAGKVVTPSEDAKTPDAAPATQTSPAKN